MGGKDRREGVITLEDVLMLKYLKWQDFTHGKLHQWGHTPLMGPRGWRSLYQR